ncbi:MAG: helix-turn-helix transcriptional regulator [Lachnospiraceae bacterium]|nr:helix-turn-helix transcriptional regulator [Lachnospiraceae bacterium]
MEDQRIQTAYIREEALDCLNIEDLKENVLSGLRTQQAEWAEKIKEIRKLCKQKDKTCTQEEFARRCGVKRDATSKWSNGAIPRHRETFLRIALTAGYTIPETDRLLQRYGGYSGLYSKTLEDCVCIYVIEHVPEAERIDAYDRILKRILEKACCHFPDGVTEDITTHRLDEKLGAVQSVEELERFILENITVFSYAYHRVQTYAEVFIQENYLNNDVYELTSINALAESQGWSSSLKRDIYKILKKEWDPDRETIISMGIHLEMDTEQVDLMLGMAHMEPLCAKNAYECAVMFILEDVKRVEEYGREAFEPVEHAVQILRKLGMEDEAKALAGTREEERELDT